MRMVELHLQVVLDDVAVALLMYVEEQARAASAALDRPRAAMQAAAMQGATFMLRSPLDRDDDVSTRSIQQVRSSCC